MQRIRHHSGQAAVGFHGGWHIKSLEGNLNLVKILLFQQADFPQGGGDHVVDDAVFPGLGFAGFGQLIDQVQMAGKAPSAADAAHRRQAAEVDADADGNVAFPGRRYYLLNLLGVPQIAGIQAQAIHSAAGAFQGQLIVKMDVGNQGNLNPLFDFGHRPGRFQIGNGRADNVAAGFLQLVDLADGGFNIPRIGLGHGLDGNIGPAADLDAAHINRFSNPPLLHNAVSLFPRRFRMGADLGLV